MKCVRVLLSTYNGEKYLEEQLLSIMGQEGVCVSLLVRDDGSTDTTCDILEQWQSKGLLEWYKGENRGFAKSFLDLIQNSNDYDYYAFCDQDDIWLPNKLSSAVGHLEHLQKSVKLYCSNTYYYKNGENFGLIRKDTPKYNIYTSLVQNIAIGCTIVFNKALKEVMVKRMPDYLIAHDYWAYQTAMIFGEVYYDPESYILYRQHDNNQIGAKVSVCEKWRRRVHSFFSKGQYGISLQAQELLRCYSDILSINNRDIISRIAYYKDSLRLRIQLVFDSKYTMGRTINNVLLRLKIVFGKL